MGVPEKENSPDLDMLRVSQSAEMEVLVCVAVEDTPLTVRMYLMEPLSMTSLMRM